MIKLTIILWILTAIMICIVRIIPHSMNSLEKLDFQFGEKVPKRIIVVVSIMLLLIITSIISTIIMIIKW